MPIPIVIGSATKSRKLILIPSSAAQREHQRRARRAGQRRDRGVPGRAARSARPRAPRRAAATSVARGPSRFTDRKTSANTKALPPTTTSARQIQRADRSRRSDRGSPCVHSRRSAGLTLANSSRPRVPSRSMNGQRHRDGHVGVGERRRRRRAESGAASARSSSVSDVELLVVSSAADLGQHTQLVVLILGHQVVDRPTRAKGASPAARAGDRPRAVRSATSRPARASAARSRSPRDARGRTPIDAPSSAALPIAGAASSAGSGSRTRRDRSPGSAR